VRSGASDQAAAIPPSACPTGDGTRYRPTAVRA
jgi:hypothetical protein